MSVSAFRDIPGAISRWKGTTTRRIGTSRSGVLQVGHSTTTGRHPMSTTILDNRTSSQRVLRHVTLALGVSDW